MDNTQRDNGDIKREHVTEGLVQNTKPHRYGTARVEEPSASRRKATWAFRKSTRRKPRRYGSATNVRDVHASAPSGCQKNHTDIKQEGEECQPPIVLTPCLQMAACSPLHQRGDPLQDLPCRSHIRTLGYPPCPPEPPHR